jgi:hypothetical protein
MRALRFRLLSAIVVGFLAQTGAAASMEVSGRGAIVDGDTLWVGSQEVRIHGIDAPVTSQKCQLPKGRGIAQYGRLIARCGCRTSVPGLSRPAWAFVKYSTDYSELEKAPRAQNTGIWQSKTQRPWEYRARTLLMWPQAIPQHPAL